MSILEPLTGTWDLRKDRSADIGRFSQLTLTIKLDGTDRSESNALTIDRNWGRRGYNHSDKISIVADGSEHSLPIDNAVVPETAMMNLRLDRTRPRAVTTKQIDTTLPHEGLRLSVEEEFSVVSSQGSRPATVYHEISVNQEGDEIIWSVKRSTRRDPLVYRFKRRGVKEAFVMHLADSWEINSDLDINALLLSIQGNANREKPSLYFVYPETWDFRFTPSVLSFLSLQRNYTFHPLKSVDDALHQFEDAIDGYVVWDPEVRTSLIVAYTIAGIENAIVVSPRLVPLAEEQGLACKANLVGKFQGRSDTEIYRWAKAEYFDRCSREYAVWIGGEHGNIMKPGVADWGVANRMFFTDLSTNPEHAEERALAAELLGELGDNALIFGWHSYAKDTEEQHVTLCSSFGHRVEGLHTLPNMSFSHHIPTSPGFTFRNNHTIDSELQIEPESKVYITCLQTDCLGIGAWTEPGRGEIPYAWEVTMNWVWLAPAMMEYFYTQATPNDYFIGALSGPGYMYPKAVPSQKLPPILRRADELMQILDLRVFEIMDYSEGFFHMGTVDLPPHIVDAYYHEMPSATAFLNGYGPANTFCVRDQRPLLSFDYYIHPTTPETQVTADLEELAQINPVRPYFLLLHVRNFADIRRVIRILNDLGEDFEVVPMDRFVTMAAGRPTFVERFLPEDN